MTKQTFAGKEMSLIFNTLSRFVIAFLLWSNHLLISWTHSPSAVILEPEKRKSVTASTFSPSICPEVMRLDSMKGRLILAYLNLLSVSHTTIWYFNFSLWIASWIFSLVYHPALASTLMHWSFYFTFSISKTLRFLFKSLQKLESPLLFIQIFMLVSNFWNRWNMNI